MGTVFNRGTKDKPNWYVGYRSTGIGSTSRRSSRPSARRNAGSKRSNRASREAPSASTSRMIRRRSRCCSSSSPMG